MRNHNQTDHIPNSFNANPKSSFTNPKFFPFRPRDLLRHNNVAFSARNENMTRYVPHDLIVSVTA